MTQIPFCEAVVFSISENLLLASSQYGENGKMSYKETSDYVRYIADERNSESGNARFIEWYLYKTTAKKPMTANFAPPIGVILPECEKFWIEQGHLYVLNPWHLEGVFEYYFYGNQKKAGSDDFLKVEVGVIYKET